MSRLRLRALRSALIAAALMAPVWWYLVRLDEDGSRLWRPSDGFFVALLVPGVLIFLRSGYLALVGRPGPYPFFGPRSTDTPLDRAWQRKAEAENRS